MAESRAADFTPRPSQPSGPTCPRAEGVGWRVIEILNVASTPSERSPEHQGRRLGGARPIRRGAIPAEPEGEKGALMQTLRVCVRSPGGGAPLAPADGVPVPRVAGKQEGPPALLHPPRPTDAVGSRPVAPQLAAAAPDPAVAQSRSPLGQSPAMQSITGDHPRRGRSGSVKTCPRCAAGRLDAASRAAFPVRSALEGDG